MYAVNWLALKPQEAEIQTLNERIEGVVAARMSEAGRQGEGLFQALLTQSYETT